MRADDTREGKGDAGRQDLVPETLAEWHVLYPELATYGQLALAIQGAAAELAIDVGTVVPNGSERRLAALIGSTMAGREPITVNLAARERWFLVSGWSQGVQLVSGRTADLTEVVRAASAWRQGAPLDEIRRAAPFVEVTSLALAHERGPADAIAEQWRILRARWSGEDPRSVAGIIEAAYAVPVLRRLFPFTSHGTLCFSTCTGYPYSAGIPGVAPRQGGGYLLMTGWAGKIVGEADDADDAIAVLLAHLPADVGPAVAGTAAGD